MEQENQMADVMVTPAQIIYVIGDPTNPFSVENLITDIPTLAEALERVKREAPELMGLDEGTMREISMKRATLVLSRIRLAFWQEYESAVQTGRRMRLTQIIGGICTDWHWSSKVLPDNEKMAWIFCPPANYTVQVKEALQAGMETIREIVSAKVVDDDGYLIPRAADVVLKAVAMLDMRVKGAIVQKIDQRTLSLNVNQNVPPREALPQSMEELDLMIEQTKAKLKQINAAPVRQLEEPMTVRQIEHAREVVDVPIERVSGSVQAKRFTK